MRYDYRCDACRWEGEGRNTVENRKNFPCPQCGAPCVIVIKSAPALHFKGGGFTSYTLRRLGNLRDEARRIRRRFHEERAERHLRWRKDPPFRVLEGRELEKFEETERKIREANKLGKLQGLKEEPS